MEGVSDAEKTRAVLSIRLKPRGPCQCCVIENSPVDVEGPKEARSLGALPLVNTALDKNPKIGSLITDQPGTSSICDPQLMIGTNILKECTNVQVDQSHSTFIYEESEPEKKFQETFMQGIKVIKADYREIERIKKTFQWNDELNLDLKEDYLMQRLTLTKKGQNPSASTTLLTTDLMEELIKQKRHRILIEGDFSTGKTTLCRYIFYQWMCGQLKSFTLVMWLALRGLHGRSIVEALAESFKEKSKVGGVKLEEFQALLRSEGEKILLLLDGIDEARGGEQENVFDILQRDTLPYTSIIATSRPIPKDIPLDCRRYIVEGISENDVIGFLSSKLDEETVKTILRHVSMDVLRRPLMLKFVAILAQSGERLTDIRTVYHVYHRLVLRAIKKYAKRYLEDGSVKRKMIHDVAKHFTDQLGPITYECLNKGTLIITTKELIEHYNLTEKDIEDQGKIGLVSFYNVFIKGEIDEEEVCEFPLKPFAEMLAVQYLKDLLVRGDPRVKDLHTLFRVSARCTICGSHIGDDEFVQGLWIHSRHLIVYLFTILNDHDEICAEVFEYFLSRFTCRCDRIYLVEGMHNRPGDLVNLDMNESVMVVILGHLSGQSKHNCCQIFLRTNNHIAIPRGFRSSNYPFSNGLRSLIQKSDAVQVLFFEISALLSTVSCYLRENPSLGRVVDRLERCLEVIHQNESISDDTSLESILSLSPYSDVLRTITQHVRVLLVLLTFMKRPFTARTAKMIEWLSNTFGIRRVLIKIGAQLIPEIKNVLDLLMGCSTKTEFLICFAHDMSVMFLEDDNIHLLFFQNNKEQEYEFQRCVFCAIGRKFVRTRSEAILENDNIVSFEDATRDSRATLAATKPTCVGLETHGRAFSTRIIRQAYAVNREIPCSCGGSFNLDRVGCVEYCSCSRKGFVNDSGLFRVQIKCSSCGTIRHERCCDVDPVFSCPHCHRDLDDSDFQSGLLLKMTCDLAVGPTREDLMLLNDFSCCPSCQSPTRQLLKCPNCAQNSLVAEWVSKGLSQADIVKVESFVCVCCMFCKNWTAPGVRCVNDQCQYFNVGLVSNSVREWRQSLECFRGRVIQRPPRQ